ncbi:MAG: hypothetical protein Tsb0020_29980 [Haliangiales bacterium]
MRLVRAVSVACVSVMGVVIATSMPGCTDSSIPEGHFACGAGSCESGVEMCVDGDGCTACEPLPAPCEADDLCSCLDGVDLTTLTYPCADQAVCDDGGEGLYLSCEPLDWGCG